MIRILAIALLVYLALKALGWVIRELILPPPPRREKPNDDPRKEGEIRIEKAPEGEYVDFVEYKEVKEKKE
jgi:hypothetical protein